MKLLCLYKIIPWNKNTRQNLTKVIKCVHLAIIQWYFNVNEVKSIIIFKPKMLSIFFNLNWCLVWWIPMLQISLNLTSNWVMLILQHPNEIFHNL
jgi:hypothetical protein